jgi:hypothetical protein
MCYKRPLVVHVTETLYTGFTMDMRNELMAYMEDSLGTMA